jgi:hypothetical protein
MSPLYPSQLGECNQTKSLARLCCDFKGDIYKVEKRVLVKLFSSWRFAAEELSGVKSLQIAPALQMVRNSGHYQ